MAAASQAQGGAMTVRDLASHQADWVEPVSQRYRGLRLHEIPPNGQGIAALWPSGMLEHFDLAGLAPDSVDTVHLQLEAMKLAFADMYTHVSDPKSMRVSSADLLDPDYLKTTCQAN
jgi:gamma-glutamyltranspeptidase/glutathione hydrolase